LRGIVVCLILKLDRLFVREGIFEKKKEEEEKQ
jgi:hypothetical protein